MTAVLSATDALRDRMPLSIDDSAINYSASDIDWRAKYNEVADMLAETRAELDDFHHASKELEAELENELQRTEKAQQDLQLKVAKAESERDEWKSKFMSLQTNHNSTTTSLQRELDRLRQEHQQLKIQMRELEMGNDDLERTERAISSSLADVEAKYSRALEEKIILEHELIDKANLEEQLQRLKDDLRDALSEILILKDQLTAAQETALKAQSIPGTSLPNLSSASASSLDDLLKTPPPADLSLAELGPSSDSLPESLTSDDDMTPRKRVPVRQGQPLLLQHFGLHSTKSSMSTPPSYTTGIPRSSTLPSYNSPRPLATRQPSAASNTSSKSKGVQMVSEMRARVKNLEQKIHTRVPRLRMGSTSKSTSTSSSIGGSSLAKSIVGRPSWENPLASKRSVDPQKRTNGSSENGGDSTGWVLIMEDSPSPPRERRDRRRASSPLDNQDSFRPAASTSSISPTLAVKSNNTLSQSVMSIGSRRPQSRLSAGSTTASSSIPTPTSRPATPTLLPVPTAGLTSLKRSVGPGLAKRSSLGSSTTAMPPPPLPRERPTTMPPPRSSRSPELNGKTLPDIPLYQNVTMRTSNKLTPSSSSSNSLSQSRIGRPSGGIRRKSTEEVTR